MEDFEGALAEESEEERARKALAAKRTFVVFVILALILAAFLVWECVDIFLGA